MKWISRYLVITGLVAHLLLALVAFQGYRQFQRQGLSLPLATHKLLNHYQGQYPDLVKGVRNLLTRAGIELVPKPLNIAFFDANYWQQHHAAVAWGYDITDHPVVDGLRTAHFQQQQQVHNSRELLTAIEHARPGTDIVLMPGRYRVAQKYIRTQTGGTSLEPIRVRAQHPGAATLEFDTREGWLIAHPYWIFENLRIEGRCSNHNRCDHAFHVIGDGRNTVINNNELVDFNAAIKINGIKRKRQYPDYGLVINNAIYNRSPRKTNHAVTPIDLVAASHWTVSDNYIADFIKQRGDKISYAAFMKGGGEDGVFERNTVLCQAKLTSAHPTVGLSFGGGGTNKASCRTGDCRQTEHRRGTLRHNLVMNCSDVAIYLSRATDTEVYNNTLLDTVGVDIRFAASNAVVLNNVVDGRIRDRNQGRHQGINNLIVGPADYVSNSRLHRLIFDAPGQAIPDTLRDLCYRPISAPYKVGALQPNSNCFRLPRDLKLAGEP